MLIKDAHKKTKESGCKHDSFTIASGAHHMSQVKESNKDSHLKTDTRAKDITRNLRVRKSKSHINTTAHV